MILQVQGSGNLGGRGGGWEGTRGFWGAGHVLILILGAGQWVCVRLEIQPAAA